MFDIIPLRHYFRSGAVPDATPSPPTPSEDAGKQPANYNTLPIGLRLKIIHHMFFSRTVVLQFVPDPYPFAPMPRSMTPLNPINLRITRESRTEALRHYEQLCSRGTRYIAYFNPQVDSLSTSPCVEGALRSWTHIEICSRFLGTFARDHPTSMDPIQTITLHEITSTSQFCLMKSHGFLGFSASPIWRNWF